MTLRELIDLGIVRDNVKILVLFSKNFYSNTYEVLRSFDFITKKQLVKAGLVEKQFDYDIVEMWGDKDRYKLTIVIKDPEYEGDE